MAKFENELPIDRCTRRRFLQAAGISAVGIATQTGRLWADEPQSESVTNLSEHLTVYHGPINVGIVRDGDRALLIDCGDGSVAESLAELGITAIEQIVFTHYHRDQMCGADELPGNAKIGVPAGEREYFTTPEEYWNDEKSLYRVARTFRPHHLMPTEGIEVERGFVDGDRFTFGSATIRVLDTPGHTDGAVSYLVEVDGQRVVFSGDCIYDEGQIWDVHSLQNGFEKGGRKVGGYHGFMGDRPTLVESLLRIRRLRPDLLVPSHGRLMPQAARAVNSLVRRFEKCYDNYVSISALRHYFPEVFTDFVGKPGQMPIRPGFEPPECLRHFGTTWMLVSESGGALVMDAGSTKIVDQVKAMLADGEIKRVDGLWVTHYHHDHTGGIVEFQKEFDCPTIAERRLADVLTEPTAWRLPCLISDPIRVDRTMEDGQSWQWNEYKLTAYFYPGQTLYHDALLVETGDLRMLFVGDSHTMAGIDDYCAYNRNWLGRDVGFQYCLSLIERLEPTHLYNCHVVDAFTFTADEIDFMRTALDRRERLFGQLVPWDHANFGLDASWVRPHPYVQQATPGGRVQVDVVITNHSTSRQAFACRAVFPKTLGGAATDWSEGRARPKSEHPLTLTLSIPSDARPGRHVIAIDVRHGPWRLPRFAEVILDVVG